MRAVNLLPREPVRRKRREGPSGHAQLLVACPLLAIVLVGAGWFFAGSRLSDKRDALAAAQAELRSIPAPKPTVEQDPAVRLAHDQRVSAIAGALGGRIAWDRVLRHVAAILPSDVWLTKLQGSASAPAAPASTTGSPGSSGSAATAESSQLQLEGYTYSQDSVARLLSRLGVVADLTDVSLRSSRVGQVAKRPVVEFSIVAGVRTGGGST
jgi:Tfp pilus assembly protein PilN